MTDVCNDRGIVKEVLEDGRVKVVVERGEACGACAARGACTVFGGPKAHVEMVLDNPVGAIPGDTVSIVISERSLLRASAILYLVPAVGLVVGAIAGHFLFARVGDADLSVAAGAGAGLLCGFAMTWALGRRVSRRPEMVPGIAAVISQVTPEKTDPPATE